MTLSNKPSDCNEYALILQRAFADLACVQYKSQCGVEVASEAVSDHMPKGHAKRTQALSSAGTDFDNSEDLQPVPLQNMISWVKQFRFTCMPQL